MKPEFQMVCKTWLIYTKQLANIFETFKWLSIILLYNELFKYSKWHKYNQLNDPQEVNTHSWPLIFTKSDLPMDSIMPKWTLHTQRVKWMLKSAHIDQVPNINALTFLVGKAIFRHEKVPIFSPFGCGKYDT